MISVIQVCPKKSGNTFFKAANPRVQKLLLRIFPWQNWWMFWINTEKYDKFMINHLSLHQPSHWSNSVHICQSYSFTKSLVQLPCFLDRASMTRKHDPWKLRSLEMECFQEFFTKMGDTFSQWEFQDPKMEVPTIYKAYFSGLCKWISPQNMTRPYGTNVPPF